MHDRLRPHDPELLRRSGRSPFDVAEATLRCIADAVVAVDVSGRLRVVNTAAERMLGCDATAAIGQRLTDVCAVVDPATRLPVTDVIRFALDRAGRPAFAHCLLRRHDGVETAVEESAAPLRDADGRARGAVLVFRDIGPTMRAAIDLAHRALHDPLTGLPNRRLLRDRLGEQCAAPAVDRRRVGLAFLDLDGLKGVNDRFGHDAGDYVLCSTAARLLAAADRDDLVCRHGGDEFVVLFAHVTSRAQALGRARQLLECLAPAHILAAGPVRVSASLGLAVSPEDGTTPDSLIATADQAMYHAKRISARVLPGRDQALTGAEPDRTTEARPLQFSATRRGGPVM